jgi:hypothetical protein
MRTSYFSGLICVIRSIDTLQCGRSLKPILVVAGVGVDDVSTFIGSCEFSGTRWRGLTKCYGYPDSNEPHCEPHCEGKGISFGVGKESS